MPRSPCHFSLLHALQERLRAKLPDVAGLTDRNMPEFVAGAIAPDGLRHVGRMGKFATHFYTEDREETWGQAVAGMFRAHPDLADPDGLSDADRVLVIGYISHLTADEAFRDVVTYQLHGRENWRPSVEGLWSLVDEIPHGFSKLGSELDAFGRSDRIGFIDCVSVAGFIEKIRPWADVDTAWEREQVYYRLVERDSPVQELREEWQARRAAAQELMDPGRRDRFVKTAVDAAWEQVSRYLAGDYKRNQEA